MPLELSLEVATRLGAKLDRLNLEEDERLLVGLLVEAAGPPPEEPSEVEGHQWKGISSSTRSAAAATHPVPADLSELIQVGFIYSEDRGYVWSRRRRLQGRLDPLISLAPHLELSARSGTQLFPRRIAVITSPTTLVYHEAPLSSER